LVLTTTDLVAHFHKPRIADDLRAAMLTALLMLGALVAGFFAGALSVVYVADKAANGLLMNGEPRPPR